MSLRFLSWLKFLEQVSFHRQILVYYWFSLYKIWIDDASCDFDAINGQGCWIWDILDRCVCCKMVKHDSYNTVLYDTIHYCILWHNMMSYNILFKKKCKDDILSNSLYIMISYCYLLYFLSLLYFVIM